MSQSVASERLAFECVATEHRRWLYRRDIDAPFPQNADVEDECASTHYMEGEEPVTVAQMAALVHRQQGRCFVCDTPMLLTPAADPASPQLFAVGSIFPEISHVYANSVMVHEGCKKDTSRTALNRFGWRRCHRLKMALHTPWLRPHVSGKCNLLELKQREVVERKKRTQLDVIRGVLRSQQ
jgi:hypothetical protein